jgi:predicted XRE-type DNA-binding protein
MMDAPQIEFEESSGDVFADIGFDVPSAARLNHKAELIDLLYKIQQERDLSQIAFAKLVGIPQPRLSRLYNGKIAGMSTDKLLEAVARIGGHVTIRVDAHPSAETAGRVELELA